MDMKYTHEKLDRIEEKLGYIDKTLAINTEQLTIHVKRTDMAEENIAILRSELVPIKIHVSNVNLGVKMVMYIISAASMITAALWAVFTFFAR